MSPKIKKGTIEAPIEVFNPSTGTKVLITDKNLPKVIKQQIKGIKDITKKVKENTITAQALKENANTLKEAGVRALKKKEAIAALQQLAKDATKLQDDFAQNQKLLFENQKQLSGALKFVFAISVTSLARTTLAIKIIKAELEKASKEELSEMERQELQGLLDQLIAQEALRTKLEKHDTWFAELGKNLQNKANQTELEQKQDSISDLDKIRSNSQKGATALQPTDIADWAKAKEKPEYNASEIKDLDIPTKTSQLNNDCGFLTEHQDISGKANISYVDEQLQHTKNDVRREVSVLQQSLQIAQNDLQKEHQRYTKLKKAFIITSICMGAVSIGVLVALLILIL